MRTGIHPPEIRAVNLDVDWIYRRLVPTVYSAVYTLIVKGFTYCETSINSLIQLAIKGLFKLHGPETGVSRMRGVGSMVIWVAILLGVSLISSYL